MMSLLLVLETPCYTFYSDLVMKGYLTWGVHLMVVAIRHNLGAASSAVCPFCGASPSMRHYVEQCCMAPLLRVFFHSQPLIALQDFCLRWGVSAVIGHDICFLHGRDVFGICLGPNSFRVPSPYPYATIGLTGEVTFWDVAFLLARGITCTALQHVVSYVLNEVAALYRITPLSHC